MTATSSEEAVQLTLTEVEEVAVALNPPGVVGAMSSGVVAEAGLDCGDVLPAASKADTV